MCICFSFQLLKCETSGKATRAICLWYVERVCSTPDKAECVWNVAVIQIKLLWLFLAVRLMASSKLKMNDCSGLYKSVFIKKWKRQQVPRVKGYKYSSDCANVQNTVWYTLDDLRIRWMVKTWKDPFEYFPKKYKIKMDKFKKRKFKKSKIQKIKKSKSIKKKKKKALV